MGQERISEMRLPRVPQDTPGTFRVKIVGP
jgi:hypothetical protein